MLLLQVVILCGTMARQLSAARLIVPLTDRLVELLTGTDLLISFSSYYMMEMFLPVNI